MNLHLAAATLSLVLMAPVGALVAAPPKAGTPVIVIVPPWLDADKMVSLAGGQIVGPTSAPLAVLAFSDDPSFVKNLLLSGALGVRDGSLMANLCGVKA